MGLCANALDIQVACPTSTGFSAPLRPLPLGCHGSSHYVPPSPSLLTTWASSAGPGPSLPSPLSSTQVRTLALGDEAACPAHQNSKAEGDPGLGTSILPCLAPRPHYPVYILEVELTILAIPRQPWILGRARPGVRQEVEPGSWGSLIPSISKL